MGGWPTLEPQEALGWPILASFARVGLVFASLFMAPFCGFAKGAVLLDIIQFYCGPWVSLTTVDLAVTVFACTIDIELSQKYEPRARSRIL